MATPQRPHRRAHDDLRTTTADRGTSTPPSDNAVLLYTPAEAANLLRVRESWLRKRAAARQVPCTFLGKHLRFSPADLAAIVANAAQPAAGRRPRRRPVTTVRDRDLPPGPRPSVHAPDRDDHTSNGSSPWLG